MRLERSIALLTALAASTALGQTITVGGRAITDGLTLPPASAATAEDAASGTINPAGIGLMRGLQLEYFHDREQTTPSIVGDGVYLAGTLFDQLALGLSLEWIRPTLGVAWPDVRKTHYSLAWSPDPAFSVGLGLNVFSSGTDRALDGLTSWDFGFTARPWSFLSIGGSIRDFDTPSYAGTPLPRRYDLGVGFRPVGPLATLAVDYLFLGEQDNAFEGLGPGNGRLALTLQIELFRLVGLLFGGSIPLNPNGISPYNAAAPAIELGLAFDTEHFGIVGAVGASTAQPITGSNGDLIAGVRFSSESFPAPPSLLARVAVVDLEKELSPPEAGLLSLLSRSNLDPYERLVDNLDDAAADPALTGVLLRYGALPDASLGKVEELRGAIGRLRAHGKHVAVLLTGGGDVGYYLATAAERVYALPLGDYLLKGFTASSLFFGEALGKLGVHVDVVRVGPYKDAPDALTRSAPSDAQEESMRALLDDAMGRYVQTVTHDRHLTPEAFAKTLDRGLTSAEQGLTEGLFDSVIYPDQIGERLHKLLGRPVVLEGDDLGHSRHEPRWGARSQIALVNVFGLITGGKSSPGAIGFGKTSGAVTVTQALREAADSASVAAIVLRVDSGGGDVEASELIWRAVHQARRRKPVVVSFGDVAASGGYYVAVAGDEILAEPSTITGSIGVFALKPNFSELLGKLGIHAFSDSKTANADLFNLTRSWSDSEMDVMQKMVDSSYQTFLSRVAAGRKLEWEDPAHAYQRSYRPMTREEVDAVGRGRVWSGQQALDRHLIDGLGSLSDAVAHAKARAQLSAAEPVDLVVFGDGATALPGLEALAGKSTVDKLLQWVPGIAQLLVLDPGRPLAVPEVQIQVR